MSYNRVPIHNNKLPALTRIGTVHHLEAGHAAPASLFHAANGEQDAIISYKSNSNRQAFAQHAQHRRRVTEVQLVHPVPSPISCLSEEILVMIFRLLVSQCQWNTDIFSPDYGPNNHIVITHVCHKWRELARSVPDLWTTIDIGPTECIEAMFARSGKLPLSIRVTEPQIGIQAPLHVMEAGRIRELTFWSDSYDPEDAPDRYQCFIWYTRYASRLQYVTYHSMTPATDSICVLSLQKGDCPPPVKHLTCHGVHGLATLCTYFARTLTHLLIVGYWPRVELFAPPIVGVGEREEFITALRAVPTLTHLDLRMLDFGPYHGPQAIVGISLPNLLSLRIADSSESMTIILRGLDFPTSTQLSLNCTDSSPAPLLDALCEVIASKLLDDTQTGQLVPFMALDVAFEPCVRVSAWGDANGLSNFALMFPSETPSSLFADGTMEAIIRSMAIAMPQVKILRIGPYGRPPSYPDQAFPYGRPLIEALHSLHHVQDLGVMGATHEDVYRLLVGYSLDTCGGSGGGQVSFTNLKRVTLSECILACNCSTPTPPGATVLSANDSPIYNAASIRQHHLDTALDELILLRCRNLCTCNMERMHALARTVDVQ